MEALKTFVCRCGLCAAFTGVHVPGQRGTRRGMAGAGVTGGWLCLCDAARLVAAVARGWDVWMGARDGWVGLFTACPRGGYAVNGELLVGIVRTEISRWEGVSGKMVDADGDGLLGQEWMGMGWVVMINGR